jgi:hypothetical protein
MEIEFWASEYLKTAALTPDHIEQFYDEPMQRGFMPKKFYDIAKLSKNPIDPRNLQAKQLVGQLQRHWPLQISKLLAKI